MADPRPPSGPVSDEHLQALAAGELPPAEAEALRARAATDPSLGARLDAAMRVESALRSREVSEPYAVPLGLVSSVLGAIRDEVRPAVRNDDVRNDDVRKDAVRGGMPRARWAVAAVLLLAASAYLSFGASDLLADVAPTLPIGWTGGAPDAAGVHEAVQAGFEGAIGHAAGRIAAVSDLVNGSDAATREPFVWLPLAIASLAAGFFLARRLGARTSGTERVPS